MFVLAAAIVYPLYLFCLAGLLVMLAPLYVLAWAYDEYDLWRNW